MRFSKSSTPPYSFLYKEVIDNFEAGGGFDKLILIAKEDKNIEIVVNCLGILSAPYKAYHRSYVKEKIFQEIKAFKEDLLMYLEMVDRTTINDTKLLIPQKQLSLEEIKRFLISKLDLSENGKTIDGENLFKELYNVLQLYAKVLTPCFVDLFFFSMLNSANKQ